MALKVVVSSLNDVLEKFREEYRPGTKDEGLEGKFILDTESVDGWDVDHTTGLKNSLSASRQEVKEWKKKAQAYGEDITPEKVQEMLAELEKLRESGDNDESTQARIDSVKAQLEEKHSKELKKFQDLVNTRDLEIENLLIHSEIAEAVGKHGGSPALLTPYLRQHCKVDRTGDKPVGIVLQEDGKSPKLSNKQGNNGNMTIDEFVESLKTSDEFAPAFSGSEATGSGKGESGDKSSRNQSKPTTDRIDKLNFTQMLRDQREKGQ